MDTTLELQLAAVQAELAAARAENARQIAERDAEIARLHMLIPQASSSTSSRFQRVHPVVPPVELKSPTTGHGADTILRDPFVGHLGAPISVNSSVGQSFSNVLVTSNFSAFDLMREGVFYELAVEHIPSFARRFSKRSGVRVMYGSDASCSSRFGFSNCLPELSVRGGYAPDFAMPPSDAAATLSDDFCASASSHHPRQHMRPIAAKKEHVSGPDSLVTAAARALQSDASVVPIKLPARASRGPGFSGELKSVDPTMLGQAIYYALMEMTAIFFPSKSKGIAGDRCFYASPPLVYSVLGFPFVGFYIAVESVGKVIASPSSLPFFLGSDEHKAAAAALPGIVIGEPVRTLNLELAWMSCTEQASPLLRTPGQSSSPSLPVTSPAISTVHHDKLQSPPRSGTNLQAKKSRSIDSPMTSLTTVYASLGVATSSVASAGLPAASRKPKLRRTLKAHDHSASGVSLGQGGDSACKAAKAALPRSAINDVALLSGATVCWARDGGEFLKLVRGDARTAEQFRDMHDVYIRLSRVLRATDRPAELSTSAQLLYGQHEVLVVLDYAEGVACTDSEVVRDDGPIMRDVARVIVWLARHCIVYTDLRGPNVHKRTTLSVTAITLIDFDDCYVTKTPVTKLTEYDTALSAFCMKRRPQSCAPCSNTFAGLFIEGHFQNLRRALDAAFTSAEASGTVTR